MKMLSVSVEGFRNIDYSKITLDDITALVGLNSYGKSNLLSAIDFGMYFINLDTKSKSRMMKMSNLVPLSRSMPSKDFKIEFEMETTIEKKMVYVIYGYKFKWVRDDKKGARIIDEWLKIKKEGKNQKYNIFINRTEKKALYKSSKTGRCISKIDISSDQLIVNKLESMDNLYYLKIINKINNLKMYIDHHFAVNDMFDQGPLVRKDSDVLELEGMNNLPKVLFYLQKEHRDKYNLLFDAFTQLFPQIKNFDLQELKLQPKNKPSLKIPENVPFMITDKIYSMFVTDINLNQPITLQNMSDGFTRILLLLTNIIIADLQGLNLIAIEEPENSIHPGLLQSYLRILSQFANNTRIIISSHSPYIIQYLEPSSIYIGLPNTEGVAKFRKVKQSSEKALVNDAFKSDMSLGDYIFELLSVSNADSQPLKKYLEQ